MHWALTCVQRLGGVPVQNVHNLGWAVAGLYKLGSKNWMLLFVWAS